MSTNFFVSSSDVVWDCQS